MIDWKRIKTVFLDLDGTLLDLHFDNVFWLEHVPRRYAETHDISIEKATTTCYQWFKAAEGTLDWYCLNYWSDALKLDIVALKSEIKHLIHPRPYVFEFLSALKSSPMKVILVTNAHPQSLDLKMQCVDLTPYFDALVSSHTLGLPKEDPQFWHALNAILDYEPQSTLLIDDNASVLASANSHGIGHCVGILKPDSQQNDKSFESFNAIACFKDVIPTTEQA